MTENKRFEIMVDGMIWDNHIDEDRLLSRDEVVDLLNNLSEENEQLKSDLDYLKTKNSSLETGMFNLERENKQLQHDASVLVQSNQEYRVENKQLKITNKSLLRCIDNIHKETLGILK